MFEDLDEKTRKAFLYGLRVPGYWDGIGDAPFGLHDIHMHIGVSYTKEQLHLLESLSPIEQGKIRAEIWNDKYAREKTLTFLHKLLSENQIKVGQHWGSAGIASEYTGTPEAIIERIRMEWNNTKEGVVNENPLAYEMSIHIILKENPWPVWR